MTIKDLPLGEVADAVEGRYLVITNPHSVARTPAFDLSCDAYISMKYDVASVAIAKHSHVPAALQVGMAVLSSLLRACVQAACVQQRPSAANRLLEGQGVGCVQC